MRACPRCGRGFPEVRGAREQACPWCAHVFKVEPPAPPAPASPVDPVAALALAARTARRRYATLLVAWAPLVVLGFVLAYPVERVVPEDVEALGVQAQLRLLGIALPPFLAYVALALAGSALVAAAAYGGARALLRRPAALLGLGTLLTFTLLAGGVLLLVPFFIFLHWFMYAPAALADGRGVGQAMEASRAFAKARRTHGFTVLVLLVGVALVALSWTLAALLQPPLEAAGLSRPAAAALAGALGWWPFAPLLALLPASYWRLASTARAAPAAPAAPPRRATTTCPRCGALVPRPDGPADVTCPACGAVGRVH